MKKTITITCNYQEDLQKLTIACHYQEDLQTLVEYMNNINFNNLKLLKIEKTDFYVLKLVVKGKREKIVEFMKLLSMTKTYCKIV